jgi:hypothetical protein
MWSYLEGNLTTSGVVVYRLFKEYLKQLCSEWLLGGDHALTLAGRIKKLMCDFFVSGSSQHGRTSYQK